MSRRPNSYWWSLASILAAVALGIVPTARATTLDPSHPVWSGPHAAEWAEELTEHRLEQAGKHVWRASAPDGLDRRAAVGARVLVIPVLPRDAGSPPASQDALRERWFGSGEGSVRGYWNVVSSGALELDGRVLPWLDVEGTLEQNYFNVRDGGPANGAAGSRALARDALSAAADAIEDLRLFDDDGPDGVPGSGDDDGVLDLVVVLHPFAAWEVDPVDTGRAILSLQTQLDGLVLDGGAVTADAVVVTSASAPLGVWVHEFGHLLGLEDLYDHDRSIDGDIGGPDQRLGGLGRWSLMASGTWGGGGSRPSGLDAWSRQRLGFGETVLVDDARSIGLERIDADAATTLEIRPAGDWGYERFLVENRARREGAVVDGDLPGSGVLVLRLDDRQGELGAPNHYVELLQADGRDDIGAGVNDGDAGDAFTGAGAPDRIGPTTLPSTMSYQPSVDRPAPVLRVGAPDAQGTQTVTVRLFDGPYLQLREAWFPFVDEAGRTDVTVGQQQVWELAFADVGDQPVTEARVDISLLPGSRPGSIEPNTDLALSPSAGRWRTTDSIVVADSSDVDDLRPLRVRLTLRVDGRPERFIEFGVPVQARPGLSNAFGLDAFTPTVFAAVGDTTRFEPLGITELPRTTSVGWGLRTDGAVGYANDVEVAVESRWLGLDARRTLSFWTRQDVEMDVPGRAWDAGVLEIHRPDRGWRVVDPAGSEVVEIWNSSRAAVRGRVGYGGEAWTWTPVSVPLPEDDIPVRLRFRFASDGSGTARGWEIAGGGTRLPGPSADLSVRARPQGGEEVVTIFRGDLTSIDVIRFRYRRPGETVWSPATGPITLRTDRSVTTLDVPAAIDVFELGVFAVLGSGSQGGGTPDLLLGRTGFRRSPAIALPRIVGNPAIGRLVLEAPERDEDLDLVLYDVRGRRVAEITIPAGTAVLEWNGDDATGVRPGSGKYFLAIDGDPSRNVPFVWLN